MVLYKELLSRVTETSEPLKFVQQLAVHPTTFLLSAEPPELTSVRPAHLLRDLVSM